MTRIFVSYSRKDETFARQLAGALSRIEADVWLDIEDIPAGMKWSSAIQEGLDDAQVMLVIVSPEAMASPNVEDEWQYALDQGTPVIPILLRPANVHFQLNRLQYIDFHNQDFDGAMLNLLREIESKTETSGSVHVIPEGRQAWPDPRQPFVYPRWVRHLQFGLYGLVAVLIVVGVVYNGLGGDVPLPGQSARPVMASEIVLPGLASIQSYSGSSRSAEIIPLESPRFTLRLVSGDDLWYAVESQSASTSGTAYVPADEIENGDLLNSLPLSVTLRTSTVQYYERPAFDAPSVTEIGGAHLVWLYGFWMSETGDVWYRMSTPAGSKGGWLYDADQRYLDFLAGYVEAPAPLPVYPEPVVSDTAQTIGAGAPVRVLAATPTHYRVLVLLDNQWQIRYGERDSLVLPAAMQTILEARGSRD